VKFVHRIHGYILERNNRSENTRQVLELLPNKRGKKQYPKTNHPKGSIELGYYLQLLPKSKSISVSYIYPLEILVGPLIPETLSVAHS